MSAVEALKAARAAGIRLGIDGDALTLEAVTSPPTTVIDLLARHKSGILALLRTAHDGWSGEDWLAYFDERAGFAKCDGDLPRDQAEARAFSCCVAAWLNRNPVRSPPGRCLGCGEAEHGQDPLLPFGTEATGHAWLHAHCWLGWYRDRKETAYAALAAAGITRPTKFPRDFGKIGAT